MQEFTVEFYDNKDFLITTYVILEENIQQALEKAKNEAYHLINIGVCVPFTVSVLNDDDHLVYKTMTKKLKGIINMNKTPSHYQGTIQPIDLINAQNLNFNLGNVVKYVCRAGKKQGENVLSDLDKAKNYINYEIERIKYGGRE